MIIYLLGLENKLDFKWYDDLNSSQNGTKNKASQK